MATRVGEDVWVDDSRPETVAARCAVESALDLARRGSGEIHVKHGRDVVTDADLAIEDRIRESLGSAFGLPVVGEERGGDVRHAGTYWLVDPICGTRNFASGIPFFAINVALVEDGQVTIAAVGDGSTGALLVAERGRGAWAYHRDVARRLFTSGSSRTVNFEIHDTVDGDNVRAVLGVAAAFQADRWDIRLLASSLSLGYVASGRLAGCVWLEAPAPMHIAAGTLLVSEAGGAVTELTGGKWSVRSRSLVCSADDAFHRELLDVIAHA